MAWNPCRLLVAGVWYPFLVSIVNADSRAGQYYRFSESSYMNVLR